MRILHAILSQGFFGSERYCIELALAQAAAGHEVAVLIRDGGDGARVFRREIAAAARPVTLIVMPAWLPSWLQRPFARRALARFSPDIVHSHLNPAARRVGREAQKHDIPHVATLHIRYDAREHADCDGLIAIARWQRRDIGPEFTGALKVVANWLPASVARALSAVTADDIDTLRRALGADAETIVFASAGRLMPEKGMETLVRAFRAAFPRGDEPARLMIVGDGELRDSLKALAAADRRITLLGRRDDIATVYRAGDVYVSAANFEPFGLTILEAMAAGCPLVLTRTQGPREFVEDERVLWSKPGDIDGLAAHLREAAAAGRQRLAYDLTRFTPGRARAEIDALYAEAQRLRNSEAR